MTRWVSASPALPWLRRWAGSAWPVSSRATAISGIAVPVPASRPSSGLCSRAAGSLGAARASRRRSGLSTTSRNSVNISDWFTCANSRFRIAAPPVLLQMCVEWRTVRQCRCTVEHEIGGRWPVALVRSIEPARLGNVRIRHEAGNDRRPGASYLVDDRQDGCGTSVRRFAVGQNEQDRCAWSFARLCRDPLSRALEGSPHGRVAEHFECQSAHVLQMALPILGDATHVQCALPDASRRKEVSDGGAAAAQKIRDGIAESETVSKQPYVDLVRPLRGFPDRSRRFLDELFEGLAEGFEPIYRRRAAAADRAAHRPGDIDQDADQQRVCARVAGHGRSLVASCILYKFAYREQVSGRPGASVRPLPAC